MNQATQTVKEIMREQFFASILEGAEKLLPNAFKILDDKEKKFVLSTVKRAKQRKDTSKDADKIFSIANKKKNKEAKTWQTQTAGQENKAAKLHVIESAQILQLVALGAGSGKAMYNLSLMYANEGNKKLEKAWSKQALRQGDANAEYDHASKLLNKKHLTRHQQIEAMIFMTSSANKGFSFANGAIGCLHNQPEHGIWVSKKMVIDAAIKAVQNTNFQQSAANFLKEKVAENAANAPTPEMAEEMTTHARIASDMIDSHPSGAAHVLKALCNENHEQALATTRPFIQKAIQSRTH